MALNPQRKYTVSGSWLLRGSCCASSVPAVHSRDQRELFVRDDDQKFRRSMFVTAQRAAYICWNRGAGLRSPARRSLAQPASPRSGPGDAEAPLVQSLT